jgi:PAS domain S-box-containing protein
MGRDPVPDDGCSGHSRGYCHLYGTRRRLSLLRAREGPRQVLATRTQQLRKSLNWGSSLPLHCVIHPRVRWRYRLGCDVRIAGQLIGSEAGIVESHLGEMLAVSELTELKDGNLAEQSQQRSQFCLSEAPHLAHMGSWAFNPSGFFDYWSDELFRIYGLDPQKGAPTLEQYLATLHPQDRESIAETIAKMQAQRCGCDVKMRIIRPDGELRYIRSVGIPVIDDAVLRGFLGTAIDITTQESLTRELERRQACLAEAERLTRTGSWAYNYLSGKYTYYSEEQFRLHGLTPRGNCPPQLAETLELIHPEDRARMRAEIARIIREKLDYVEDFRIVLPDGTVKYLQSFGHATLDEAGELVQHSGTAMDVTERRRGEQRLLAQQHVARILAEVTTVEQATPRILQAMCECLACHLGVFWRIDREAGVLRCHQLWHPEWVEVAEFEAATRASAFAPGSGQPGRVWASRAPAHIADVVHDPGFTRAQAAACDGLHAAFAFPVSLDNEVLGVVELFSRDVWQREEALLATLATIGSQIGQFIERKRAETALQLAQAELARMTRMMSMPVERTPQCTLLHPAALLREQIAPEAAAAAADSRGRLLAWQARKVRDYIDAHIAGPVRVADLCALVQRSEAHFSRAFKCTFGESPHAFVIRRRLKLAAQYMLQSDASLCDISLRCGFTDQAHLCKHFRQATGRTPAAWRRERRTRDDGISVPHGRGAGLDCPTATRAQTQSTGTPNVDQRIPSARARVIAPARFLTSSLP